MPLDQALLAAIARRIIGVNSVIDNTVPDSTQFRHHTSCMKGGTAHVNCPLLSY